MKSLPPRSLACCALLFLQFAGLGQDAAPATDVVGPADRTGGGPPFGPRGPQRTEKKLVTQFDVDGDTRLDADERKAAREFLAKERVEGSARVPGGGPPRGSRPFGPRENDPPPEPGRKLTPADVKSYRAIPLYDPQTLRTFFFEFENTDWEKELADFHGTDVEVPARLTVDGKTFEEVGVDMRGASSFMMVGEGRKRSFGVSLDSVRKKQKLDGYRSLHLLNSHGDPSFLRAVLFNQIAREYLAAPKTNLVRVVINGESWGIYVNQQPFDKTFVEEWFGTKKGARWKAPGRPGGNAGLEYTGDDVAEYKKRFELKSKDDPEAWARLIELCRALNETPADQLEETLAPILDIDGALRFLALDNALINNDGYWVRASDYSLLEDESGRFHVIPHDTNESFSVPGGPGFGARGPRPARADTAETPAESSAPLVAAPEGKSTDTPPGAPPPPGPGFGGNRPPIKGVELDPLVAASDPKKPLASKLLAVPALRARYLGYVKEIAEQWLDWEKLGPIAQSYAQLIANEIHADTRKLETDAAFEKSIDGAAEDAAEPRQRGPGRRISLKSFAEQRRAYLLSHPAITALESSTGTR